MTKGISTHVMFGIDDVWTSQKESSQSINYGDGYSLCSNCCIILDGKGNTYRWELILLKYCDVKNV